MKYVAVVCGVLTMVMVMALQPACSKDNSPPKLRDGDIIFHQSTSSQSTAIKLATGSKYTHMGIIYLRNGNAFVYEAIKTVQLTPLDRWIARGVGKHVVVKRLRDADTRLTPKALAKLKKAGRAFKGKPYDIYFGWSDKRIYCSELVWKMYNRALGIEIGPLKRLKDFDLSHKAVAKKMKERYGSRVPSEEQVISPGDMFDSPLLKTVYAN